MKNIVDITDEDVISVINTIHPLTKNRVISRNGIPRFDFHESFKKFGSCYIDIELKSIDVVSDGHFTSISKCRIQIVHDSFWFVEFTPSNSISAYNKNHFFGYLKLQELGYKFPDSSQIA